LKINIQKGDVIMLTERDNDIIKHLTYKGKCALSEKTIRETLSELCEENYITKKQGTKKLGVSDTYKINIIIANINNIFSMSYFPTLICIYGIITPEDLRLYTYMRYKLDESIKEDKSHGNIFTISQEDLAKDLDVSQPRISEMINNLIESKILEIWEVKFNNNGYKYYTYRLVK
jgi:CTP-dependent riboflavin kinase